MALQLVGILAGISTLAALVGALTRVRAEVTFQLACLESVKDGHCDGNPRVVRTSANQYVRGEKLAWQLRKLRQEDCYSPGLI